MCLILFRYNDHSDYRLILAANRDEYYHREAEPLHRWDSGIFAGRDVKSDGTWMGITKSGRFAALTNYRNRVDFRDDKKSRGSLVTDFLTKDISQKEYARHLKETASLYNGYNLIFGDMKNLCWFTNKKVSSETISSGTYGLSNAFLDIGWTKVLKGKKELIGATNRAFNTEGLMKILSNSETAPDKELPSTGVSLEFERMLSPIFIKSEKYGTRCSSVLTVTKDGKTEFTERTFSDERSPADVTYRFQI